MANQDVRVSALQSASTLSTNDLALATVVDELSETGYTSKKITEGAKAAQYLEAFTFANLNTTAKTIVGAINEAATTGGADEFIIHMTDTTVTETATDIIDAFDNGSEIWLESQITGETITTRLPLLAYISDSSQLVLRFSGITYANNKYRYCDVQMLRSPEQIVGRQSINVSFAVIDDATTSASSVWSSQKTASELAGKAEIDDTAVSSSTAWSSEQIVSLLPTESASGAVANFETPLTLPLVSHNVTIEPVQSGTGDPSPSNPRAISGWSAVNVTRTGKNLAVAHDFTSGIFVYSSNGKIKINGTISETAYVPTASQAISNDLCFALKAGTYIPSTVGTLPTGAFVNVVSESNVSLSQGAAFTLDKETKVFYRIVLPAGNYNFETSVQIEVGSTATTYEAYNGTEYEIDLDDTTYAGELNVKTGEGSITHTIYDMSDLSWSKNGATPTFYSGIIQGIKEQTADFYCSCYLPSVNGGYNAQNLQCSLRGEVGQTRIWVCDNSFETSADFRASLTNQKIVLPKATPTEITLTPVEIATFKGTNNIWADTGDTAVEYKQDIQTYIDNRLSSGTRSLSLAKVPIETEETKQEEQEGDEDVNR